MEKTYGQKQKGARLKMKSTPANPCRRLLVFHDESSRQLEEVTLSHARPQESPRARSSALTKWQLRGTHAPIGRRVGEGGRHERHGPTPRVSPSHVRSRVTFSFG